jgi:prepilin-type N-terminal cleavage/methylation domain-containing protein
MKSQRAFTLLEVIVSLGIFSIVTVGIYPAVINHLQTNHLSAERTSAIHAAQQVLDNLRLVNPGTLPPSGSTQSEQTIGDKTFQVTTTYCEKSAYCVSPNTRHLKVEVFYEGEFRFETETVYTQLK